VRTAKNDVCEGDVTRSTRVRGLRAKVESSSRSD
jgi:hypothetical protein